MRSFNGFGGFIGRLSVVVAVVMGSGATALAKPSTGTIYFTDHVLDPNSSTFEKDVTKSKAVFEKTGDSWNLFFVAYLKKPAGATEVNLAFYETTAGKRENVNAIPIQGIKDTSRTVMSSVQLSTEQSFKPGHKYEVLVTRLINGKEEVYARSKIELK